MMRRAERVEFDGSIMDLVKIWAHSLFLVRNIWLSMSTVVANCSYVDLVVKQECMPRMLCNRNGAISHLQTEMGFVEDFRYSLYN